MGKDETVSGYYTVNTLKIEIRHFRLEEVYRGKRGELCGDRKKSNSGW